MAAKPAVIAALSGFCFVPAATLALTHEPTPVAFRALDGIEARVDGFVRSVEPEARPVELRPVLINGARRGRARDAPQHVSECDVWRALKAGPTSQAQGAGAVRPCNGVPPLEAATLEVRAGSDPNPNDAPRTTEQQSSARVEFVVDLRKP